jgi:hypothetical protein
MRKAKGKRKGKSKVYREGVRIRTKSVSEEYILMSWKRGNSRKRENKVFGPVYYHLGDGLNQ